MYLFIFNVQNKDHGLLWTMIVVALSMDSVLILFLIFVLAWIPCNHMELVLLLQGSICQMLDQEDPSFATATTESSDSVSSINQDSTPLNEFHIDGSKEISNTIIIQDQSDHE